MFRKHYRRISNLLLNYIPKLIHIYFTYPQGVVFLFRHSLLLLGDYIRQLAGRVVLEVSVTF